MAYIHIHHTTSFVVTATIIVATALLLLSTSLIPASASGFIHFKPDNNATILANQPITVNGTSAPSNSTRTGCIVSLATGPVNTFSADYKNVTAQGPQGSKGKDYTKWSTTAILGQGKNELEAQLLCHGPNGQGVSFIKHLVHNVTGMGTGPVPTPSAAVAGGNGLINPR